MIKKLKRKFILITVVIVFVVICSIIGVINIINFRNLEKETDKVLNVLEENDGKMPLPPFRNPNDPAGELSPEIPYQTRYFTVLYGIDGQIEEINLNNVFSINKAQAETYARKAKNNGYLGNYKYRRITTAEGKDMIIFLNCTRELISFKFFLRTSLTIGISAILFISVLVIVISSVVVKPIAESYEKQKRFITDANHEIKTPLTIISAANEVMEMEYGQSEWSKTVSAQVDKLNGLTEKLVFLSKMEEENAKIPFISFNLSLISGEIAQSFKSIAQVQEKELLIDIEPDLFVTGEQSLIGQMISILLDNAFKYSSRNGLISFTLKSTARGKKLTVKNTVDQIKKGNLEKLFDRFYREDSSRNSETGGSGIGLSVAKAVVNLHKGKLSAFSHDGKTVEFVVVLP